MILLELEALKKQEEIDEQLAAKKRQAEIRKKHEEMDKIIEELEIIELQKEKARASRISEKQIEKARAGNNRASTSLWSVSLITVQSNPLEKVPSWLDQITYESKATKKDSGLARTALDSRPIQPLLHPLPQTLLRASTSPIVKKPHEKWYIHCRHQWHP